MASAVVGLMTCPAEARTRALLIGAAIYDPALGVPNLKGPPNDVRLLHDTLAARGVTEITELADGVEGAARPTHAAILLALADLARDSEAGDLAIISMSGHGTRQPDQNGDETDGLDEVFLPSDIDRAENGAQVIPNALVDDEIGAAVLAIRQKGADVVLVMDSCHSGSGMRDGAANQAARLVDPALLGINVAAMGSGASVSVLEDEADAPGQVVAFFAARSEEVAREVNLTPDVAGDNGWYGLFTARLAARLAAGEGLSYRQLFQGVLADMNDTSLPGGGPLQTPSWEGGLIDAAVLGGRTTLGVRQFAVTGDQVAAGLVQGFGSGTLFSLVADAADPANAVVGYAQLDEVEAVRGYLRPVAAGCVPKAAELCPVAGTLPATARFARLMARPVDLALRLAPARDLTTGLDLPADDPLAQALAAAMASAQAPVVTDPVRASVQVLADNGRLWFGRRAAMATTPVGLSWGPGDKLDLPRLLERMAVAERLATLLTSAAAEGSVMNPSPIAVKADLAQSRLADLDKPGQAGNPVRECRRAMAGAEKDAAFDLGSDPELKQCDQVSFAVQGEIQGARDVNRVHIDSQYCVHAAHTRVEDTTRPTALGAPMVICSDCPDGAEAGDERLFVVVTEAEANSDQLNLEGLVENCEPAGTTRGAASQSAMDFLTTLGKRPDTRGAFGGLALSGVWVDAYYWQVLPKALAFARQE
ncbi:MAG: caspase family protein [bacterium]